METNELMHDMMELGSTRESGEHLSPIHAVGIAMTMAFVGVLAGYSLAKWMNIHDEVVSRAEESAAGPFVQTVHASMGIQERLVKALGESRPYNSVTLYAKISGYLRTITVDKGDRVKKGQLLATIDSPETFSQYEGALASSINRRAMSERAVRLHKQKVVTDQEEEQAVADADVATARLNELGAQKAYSQILAPFDGVVTARFVDPGALMQNAGQGQTGAQPIVTVSQTDRLRVTIFVDQRDAPFVKVGDSAQITTPERPDSRYNAVVSRTAGELDTRSRTMLTEIELDNTSNEIVAGSFVDVTLKVQTPGVVQVPSEALVMKGTRASVMVVSHDHTVHAREVQGGENDGTKINILHGLEVNETVALDQGNNLIEGQHIQN
jgi:membrane fusion protein (multidrug efflux system)